MKKTIDALACSVARRTRGLRVVVAALSLPQLLAAALLLMAGTSCTAPDRREKERGDVPGWVLVTLMTAGLVTAIWAVAGPQLVEIFTKAISSVKGP